MMKETNGVRSETSRKEVRMKSVQRDRLSIKNCSKTLSIEQVSMIRGEVGKGESRLV